MKKLTTTFLTACMIAQLMLLPVSANEKYIYKDNVKANNMPERIMLSDFCNNSRLQSDGSGYVLAISEDDLYNVEVPDETLALSLNNFLEDNGIVLLYTDSKWTSNVFDELLDLPVCADLQIEQPTDAVDEPGVDVATLYYRKNGKVATHTLNVSNSTEIDVDSYIDELIAKTATMPVSRRLNRWVSYHPPENEKDAQTFLQVCTSFVVCCHAAAILFCTGQVTQIFERNGFLPNEAEFSRQGASRYGTIHAG